MKKTCLIIGAAVSLADATYAQRDSLPGPFQAVYMEGLGPGGYGSINYERIVASLRNIQLHMRAGLGSERFLDHTRAFNPDLTMPIGLLFTKGKRWQADLGGGGTITSFVYPDDRDFHPTRKQAVHAWLSAGVRYVPEFRGWMLRVAYTPLIEFGRWRHWGGLSLGYTF